MKKIILLLVLTSFWVKATDVFNTPGRYVYGNDVIYLPTTDNEPAISIEASNIIIDLAGHAITLDPATTNTGTIGIQIAPNLSNIVITNGTIGGLNGPGIVVNDGCSQVYIDKMAIRGCTDKALFCNGVTTGIRNLSLSNSSFVFTQSTTTAYGAHLIGCDNIGIANCQLIGNGLGVATSAYATRLESCQGALITGSNFVQTSGTDLAVGVSFSGCQDCLLQNCIIFNNLSTAASGAGYGCMLDGAASAENRIFACTITSNGNTAGSAAAVFASAGTNNIVQNCTLEFSTGDTLGAGIIFDGETSSHIEDCKITGNNALTGSAYGVLLLNTNTNCYVANNVITSTNGAGGSFGITDQQASSTNCILSNSGFNNGTNYLVNYPAGITLPTLEGSLSNSTPGMPNNDAWDNFSINA